MINFQSDNTPIAIPVQLIRRWLTRIAAQYNFTIGNICYRFCDDDTLLSINQQFLQHDYYTDIITFDYSQNNILHGDICISTDTVNSNAKRYDTQLLDGVSRELYRVIVHGLLHLMGQNDKTEDEAKDMRDKENQALDLFQVLLNQDQ